MAAQAPPLAYALGPTGALERGHCRPAPGSWPRWLLALASRAGELRGLAAPAGRRRASRHAEAARRRGVRSPGAAAGQGAAALHDRAAIGARRAPRALRPLRAPGARWAVHHHQTCSDLFYS